MGYCMNATLLSPPSLLATVSFWQHLPFVWVKVKYPFGFGEESNIFTAHPILVKVLFLGCEENFATAP